MTPLSPEKVTMIHSASQKQQRAKQFHGQTTLPEWPAYLRAVPDTETRQRLAASFKAAGLTLDQVCVRSNSARVAGAITAVEDWLELRHSTAARLEMRAQLCRIRRLAESMAAS